MEKDRVGQVEEIPCVRCGWARHTIRGTYDAYWDDEDSGVSAGSTYDLMECSGCQRGTLRVSEYGANSPGEDFAEACMMYTLGPRWLEEKFPLKFAALQKIMGGK
jgi:hypothetical protein